MVHMGKALLAMVFGIAFADPMDDTDGHTGCKCLGGIPASIPTIDCAHSWAPGGQCVTVAETYGDLPNKEYAATYGAGCTMHAEPADSNCYDDAGGLKMDGADYCFKPWCYVDPCFCDLKSIESSAFGGTMSYSYETCGSTDTYSSDDTVSGSCAEGDNGFTDDRDACVEPGSDSYEMFLAYPSHNKTITVPPIPTDVNMFRYATDNAIVGIPATCVDSFMGKEKANFADRQPGGPTGMHYMRVSDPMAEYSLFLEIAKSQCASGLVVLMHGTSGAGWQSVSYVAQTSGAGYLTIMLDSHAMPASMGLKGENTGAGELKSTEEMDLTDYCGSLSGYNTKCKTWNKPYCYSTKVENVLNDRVKYKRYVERNYLIRKMELDYFVQSQQDLLDAFEKVFLLGRSEGGMSAARYYHPDLHPKLSGMILSGASCEYTYFASCAENTKICGGQCSKELPILNVNGEADYYFGGQEGSVSARIAASPNGYGGPITGNCAASLNAQDFRFGTVVSFKEDVGHSIMYSHDNALRSVLYDFMASPKASSTWKSIQREGCSYTAGAYYCDEMMGPSNEPPCQPGWGPTNPNASMINMGSTAQYPMTCKDLKDNYKAHGCCGNPSKRIGDMSV